MRHKLNLSQVKKVRNGKRDSELNVSPTTNLEALIETLESIGQLVLRR